MLTVKIIANEHGAPAGKLADAELHFLASTTCPDSSTRSFAGSATANSADAMFDGLKLIGFAIWERRAGGGRNVTFPARQYSVNGERRSFALLRPVMDSAAQDRVRELILQAYAAHEDALQAQ